MLLEIILDVAKYKKTTQKLINFYKIKFIFIIFFTMSESNLKFFTLTGNGIELETELRKILSQRHSELMIKLLDGAANDKYEDSKSPHLIALDETKVLKLK